jgi:hypothetical protein
LGNFAVGRFFDSLKRPGQAGRLFAFNKPDTPAVFFAPAHCNPAGKAIK